MIEINITQSMIDSATKKSIEMGKLNNSITMGDGNIAGFLGEEIANTIIGGRVDNTYDYDIIDSDTTYDVKTKRCTSKPKPEYDCSVAAFNIKQRCDRYVFVRLENVSGVWRRAWVLGWMKKDEYFKLARFLKKGDFDPSNKYFVKADCYNLQINMLHQFDRKII